MCLPRCLDSSHGRAQNKRDLARKLKGPTLGDSEPSSSTTTTSKDTLKWLKQSQKRAKEHAARRAKELEEQDALAAQQASYGESDLAGLRVAHELDDFAEGEERILTLRDSRILDGGDDELMDDMLAQQERDRQNIERKKGAKAYTGLDEDDIGAGLGKKKSVLAKYDADIRPDGQPQEDGEGGFRLGVVAPNKVDLVRRQQEETAERMNKKLLSLDYSSKWNARLDDQVWVADHADSFLSAACSCLQKTRKYRITLPKER